MVVPAGTPVPVTVMPAAGAPEMDVSVDVEFPVSLDEDTVAVFVAPFFCFCFSSDFRLIFHITSRSFTVELLLFDDDLVDGESDIHAHPDAPSLFWRMTLEVRNS